MVIRFPPEMARAVDDVVMLRGRFYCARQCGVQYTAKRAADFAGAADLTVAGVIEPHRWTVDAACCLRGRSLTRVIPARDARRFAGKVVLRRMFWFPSLL